MGSVRDEPVPALERRGRALRNGSGCARRAAPSWGQIWARICGR